MTRIRRECSRLACKNPLMKFATEMLAVFMVLLPLLLCYQTVLVDRDRKTAWWEA